MVRAFIAIELASDVRDRIRESQERLRTSRARLTLVDPAIIHITLQFLGEIDPVLVPRIAGILKEIGGAPFEIIVRGIELNSMRNPRVIWCQIEDGGSVSALHASLEAKLAPLGFPSEKRTFRPHATVARIREFHPSLTPIIRSLENVEHGTSCVRGIMLKESRLTPKGPVYSDLSGVIW